ncbi:MAG TPA: hypothetical protein PK129_05125 [Cellvibrionaceae bacterium]|nr:hypothetical protein [Cellvibrionaceae bacterium]
MKLYLLFIVTLSIASTSCSLFDKPVDCSSEDAQKIVSKILIEQTQNYYQQKAKNVTDGTLDVISGFNIRYDFARPEAYAANLKKYECVANVSIVFAKSPQLGDLMSILNRDWAKIEKFNSSGLSDHSMPFFGLMAAQFASKRSLKKIVDLSGVTLGDNFISKPIKYSVQETDKDSIYVEITEWETLVDAATLLMAMGINQTPSDIRLEEQGNRKTP